MLSPLDKKLLREVWRLRGQMVSIAAVVAVGIMTVLTMRGAYESLISAQASYYQEARFPDVWASLVRAPESVRASIEAIEGVTAVETRVTFQATVDPPATDAPGLGRFVSIPDERRSMLADLHLEAGRYIAPGRRDEVILSKRFAVANELVPGDTLDVILNGRARELRVVGTAISPEHIYVLPPGALAPEDERFGIVWMGRGALGPVFEMDGAFNDVVLTLGPDADADHVIDALDAILEPYGGLGAYERADQTSHLIVQSELDGVGSMGTAIPAVFLLVAAFLLNIVLGRMIATQRTEIAVLKAFGYRNREVGAHYLKFALFAVMLGTLAGVGIGIYLGREMVELYGKFFDFPTLRYEVSWKLVGISLGVSALAAAVGALGAVWRAVSLPPAEAMRPEAPARFGAGLFERMGLGALLPESGRMILRNIERKPARSVFSAIGVGFSVAILVVGLFQFDGVQLMMELQFEVAQREDVSLTFHRPLPRSVRHDLARLEGVTRVEPFRAVPVRLRSAHRSRETAIIGLEPGAQLRRIVTSSGGTQPVPLEGLMLSALLAEELRVTGGDDLLVEVLEGRRREVRVPVAGIVDDFIGVSAYMSLDAVHRMLRGPRTFSGAYLAIEPTARAALYAELEQLPVVAAVASPAQMRASFDKQLAESLFISIFFLLFFSSVISVAVIYNGARIALSERGRELASLRVFGFSKLEVATLLLGEQAIVTLAGIPVGWGLGYLLARSVAESVKSETYRMPFVLSANTLLSAAAATLVAAALSGWLVRRRLDRMNLIEVLKTRE